nr:MAG TPA: hypothetical protein [Caudoviricetes sp.]
MKSLLKWTVLSAAVHKNRLKPHPSKLSIPYPFIFVNTFPQEKSTYT